MARRSVEDAVLRGVCPFCLGHVGLHLRCYSCGRDSLSWRGEILPTSAAGQMLLADEAKERARIEAYQSAASETVARFYEP